MDKLGFHLLFDTIDKIGQKADKENWAFYHYSRPFTEGPQNIKLPCILYKTHHRKTKDGMSRKASQIRQLAQVSEKGESVEEAMLYQGFAYFGILSRDNNSASRLMNWFEGFIHNSQAEIKSESINEMVFEEQLEDETVEIHDNYFLVKPLIYYVDFNRVYQSHIPLIGEIKTELSINH